MSQTEHLHRWSLGRRLPKGAPGLVYGEEYSRPVDLPRKAYETQSRRRRPFLPDQIDLWWDDEGEGTERLPYSDTPEHLVVVGRSHVIWECPPRTRLGKLVREVHDTSLCGDLFWWPEWVGKEKNVYFFPSHLVKPLKGPWSGTVWYPRSSRPTHSVQGFSVFVSLRPRPVYGTDRSPENWEVTTWSRSQDVRLLYRPCFVSGTKVSCTEDSSSTESLKMKTEYLELDLPCRHNFLITQIE